MNTLPYPVTIPLINPNEPGALIASLDVQEGQQVSCGARLCTLETTKATQELFAEADGYIVGLKFKPGETAYAGATLCHIAASPDWQPPAAQPGTLPAKQEASIPTPQTPAGLRISQPALHLAQQAGLELSLLPADTFITEAIVRSLLDVQVQPGAKPYPENALIIYGGGGHGKSLVELVHAVGSYHVVGIIDDGLAPGSQVLKIPVLGGAAVLPALRRQGLRLAINAVGGIGNLQTRLKVFAALRSAGFAFPSVVHPTVYIEPSVILADGVQVFAHAYIGSQAQIGWGAIINTGAIVSHDCRIGDYANISPGAILAGEVIIGAETLVGMGVTINLQVEVGQGVRIGNGATVKSSVPDNGVVRAGSIWPG